MKDLPRRPIEPLTPPAGSFDAVLGQARHRRQRRVGALLSVAAIFFAGIAGGMSLDAGVSGVRDTFVGLTTADNEVTGTQEPNTSAVVTPEVDATQTPVSTSGPDGISKDSPGASVVAIAPPATPTVRGIAVDTTGGPIAGLYVYPGRRGPHRFLATDEPAARTAEDGSFSLPCTGTPVLLSPWPINAPMGTAEARAVWAATFVGGGTEAASAADAPCTADGTVFKTTVLPGSTLKGTVTMPEECVETQRPLWLWLWLYNDRSVTVRLPDLSSGGSFSVGGLPPGQHTLAADGNHTSVTVGGGETTTQDLRFGCEPGSPPVPTPSPSTSPTPLPTPSDTSAPLPTGITSSAPEPSST